MKKNWLLYVMVLAVYALHQDFWFWRSARPLVFGLLPVGLAYHAGYTLLTAAALGVLIRFAWPSHLDSTGRFPGGEGNTK